MLLVGCHIEQSCWDGRPLVAASYGYVCCIVYINWHEAGRYRHMHCLIGLSGVCPCLMLCAYDAVCMLQHAEMRDMSNCVQQGVGMHARWQKAA